MNKTNRQNRGKGKGKIARPTLLPFAQAAAELGVDPRQLERLVGKGLPVQRKKPPKGAGGPARRYVDVESARAFVAAQKRGRAGKKTALSEIDIDPPRPLSKKERNDLAKGGIVGALARARRNEVLIYEHLDKALCGGNMLAAAALQDLYNDALKELRLTEKDTPGILEHRGEAIPLETVLEEAGKIDMAIKTELLGLPRKVAVDLAHSNDPAEIEDRLNHEIDAILRHLANTK